MEYLENLYYKQLEEGCKPQKAVTWYLYVRYWDRVEAYECRTTDLYRAVGALYCKSIESIERVDYTQNRPSMIEVLPYPYPSCL